MISSYHLYILYEDVHKIYQMIEEDRFPKWIKIDRSSFWLRSQITAWKKAQVIENQNRPWKDKWVNVPRTKGQKRYPEKP